jgi:hypothetical protein
LLYIVWGHKPNEKEQDNITQQIHVLRKALGETPGANEYIETVPREGYRFVAHVKTVKTADGVPTQLHTCETAVVRLSAGNSGNRTVVLGADEDHIVGRSGEVIRPGDPFIEDLIDMAGNTTKVRTGTIVRACDGSNELLVEDLEGEITGVLKRDRAGNIYAESIANEEDDYDFLSPIVEDGSGNMIAPPENGTGTIAPKGRKRSGPRSKRSRASRGRGLGRRIAGLKRRGLSKTSSRASRRRGLGGGADVRR